MKYVLIVVLILGGFFLYNKFNMAEDVTGNILPIVGTWIAESKDSGSLGYKIEFFVEENKQNFSVYDEADTKLYTGTWIFVSGPKNENTYVLNGALTINSGEDFSRTVDAVMASEDSLEVVDKSNSQMESPAIGNYKRLIN